MTDDEGTAVAKPQDNRSPAHVMLSDEFARCSAALVNWDAGHAQMADGRREFDRLWAGIIQNTVRLFGKSATRDALNAMGRPEDVTKLY